MPGVVLTGASSFTGLWIAEALAGAGFHVTAPLRRARGDYTGVRAWRVERLATVAEVVFETPLASDAFGDLLAGARADLLAHHAADIPGYRSPDYDAQAGVARNLAGVPEAVAAFAKGGGRALLATGTYFESGEGGGEAAASPYGLSKALTNAAQARLARQAGLGFGKFVIPAPFGPWEEGRIVWSLFQAWVEGRPGEVRTPAYVRDHLPAPLLARAYAEAASAMLDQGVGEVRFRPSGMVMRVGDFARAVADQVRARTGLACEVLEHPQAAFPEPEARANDQPRRFGPGEAEAFWDAYVAFYDRVRAQGLLASTPA
ncbi:NAD-dependent epimerase/dehydratase family protein [Phenylobacterium sp.]|uniref:NAD-dependent epimerase/dehydratase family protein n=1 Tax=Phenylobacterium sp. TaxID=1871053 RepID=UPI00395602ED